MKPNEKAKAGAPPVTDQQPVDPVARVAVEADVSCFWGLCDDGWWQSQCGHRFEFFDDGPPENGFIFCPYCGAPLRS